MKKKFYGMLAAVLIASCICVPQVKYRQRMFMMILIGVIPGMIMM